jgi:hypothetical protein
MGLESILGVSFASLARWIIALIVVVALIFAAFWAPAAACVCRLAASSPDSASSTSRTSMGRASLSCFGVTMWSTSS